MTTTIDIVDGNNTKLRDISLSQGLFEKKVNQAVLYQAVKTFLAGKHHGTVDTKTRAEVLRTGKKVYRQKGTGNARHGSKKSSPFVGGGRVFGPHPRDYSLGLPKKVKRLALREALKSRILDEAVTVIEDFGFGQIKTKEAARFFLKMGIGGGLVVLEGASDIVKKSVRNIPGFKVVRWDQLNVVDLLHYPRLVFTAASFEVVKQKYL